jgi:predicted nuclease with TOPRIM domain
MREAVNTQLQQTRARSWTFDEEREKVDGAIQSKIKQLQSKNSVKEGRIMKLRARNKELRKRIQELQKRQRLMEKDIQGCSGGA